MVISLASCKVKQLSFMASEEDIALRDFSSALSFFRDLIVTRNPYQDGRVAGICKVMNFSCDLICSGGVLILLRVLNESLTITTLSIHLVLMKSKAYAIVSASAENIENYYII